MLSTDLQNTNFKYLKKGEVNGEYINFEYEKLLKCSYLILVFPYIVTGVPSIVKDWLDKVFIHAKRKNNLPFQEKQKALIISITDFPEESFQPNALHRSTLKRRLHHLLYGTLKSNGISPLEPLFFYNYGFQQQTANPPNQGSNNGSSSFNFAGGDDIREVKEKKEEGIEFENNSNLVSHSIIFKKSKKSKESQMKDEFLINLNQALTKIEELQDVDVSEL